MTDVKKKLDYHGDREGVRRATPLEIAKYKAARIGSRSVVDLGCGIGVQLIEFAKVSKDVLGVELERKYIEFCRKNIVESNLNNVKLVKGDALDSNIIKIARNYEVVNSDPSREKTSYTWELNNLSPNPKEILRKYNQEDFSFDIPVRFNTKLLSGEPELEYVSLGGEPKRLILYYGCLKKYELSAISLPSMERIVKGEEKIDVQYGNTPDAFIYDIDQVISLSGLIGDFKKYVNKDFEVLEESSQRFLITSDDDIRSSFVLGKYKVLKGYNSLQELRKDLKNYYYGRIYIRFEINPKHYYNLKKDLEFNALGIDDIYIFKFDDKYYTSIKEEN